MIISTEENYSQSYTNTNNKAINKEENSFEEYLTKPEKEEELEIGEDDIKKENEEKKKLLEDLLKKIKAIVNSGIHPDQKEKIDELMDKIKEYLNEPSSTYSFDEIQNLMDQLQSLMNEAMKNFTGNMLDNIDPKDNTKKTTSINDENELKPISNYNRVDIEDELKKFQNIKIDTTNA